MKRTKKEAPGAHSREHMPIDGATSL